MSSRSADTLLSLIADEELEDFAFDWETWAHDQQKTPPGDWTTWLLMGGRGAGKTMAGAQWVRSLAAREIGPIAIVGQTIVEALQVMVRGESGILRMTPPDDRPIVRGQTLLWPNGTEGLLLGASDPERFRGPQFAAAWCDEVGKWPNAEDAWDMLQFGLRLGDDPRQMATTTPRATPLMRRLVADPLTVVTKMPTKVNQNNLARTFFKAIVARYENTVLGRQELEGELIEDRPDALWTRAMFRPDEGREIGRIVVAVDPPVSGHRRSDACGIVVAGKVSGASGEGAVVLADLSFGPAKPDEWARLAVAAFHEFGADCIVAETNQGGDMVKAVIGQVDRDVPVRGAHARRGKWVRAEPVAALYANGRVVHRAGLTALEDEMCAFGADGLSDGHSPDRVDALVWALTELLLGGAEPRVRGI